MSKSDQPTLSTLRKRRGITRASITRLNTKLKDLETMVHEPTSSSLAQRMGQKLDILDAEFKKHHYALIDAIDETEAEVLDKEQDVLDRHDDDMTNLAMKIEQIIAICNLSSDSGAKMVALRRVTRLRTNLSTVDSEIRRLTTESAELHLLHQYQEHISDCKKELGEIRQTLLSLGLREGDELETSTNSLEREVFDCSLQLKKLILTPATPPSTTTASRGVRLPKIEVPTFDGNLLNWRTFWEQFSISVHDRSSLSDTEKLVYLRQSLKDGTAKKVIEGLSQSGDQYTEAIGCLTSRYDRPRIIHQTHVKKIIEISSLKEGSGKELRYLHDTAQQHLRALKAMGQEPSGPFITSMLELKLD